MELEERRTRKQPLKQIEALAGLDFSAISSKDFLRVRR